MGLMSSYIFLPPVTVAVETTTTSFCIREYHAVIARSTVLFFIWCILYVRTN